MFSIKKNLLTAGAAAALAVTLTGCHAVMYFQQEVMGFDASGYVEATLDCQYKAEFQEYKKLTKSTDEEAANIYEEGMEAESISFEYFYNVTLNDDDRAKVIDMYKLLYTKAQYTVGEAVRNKSGSADRYMVEVRVKPLQIFDNIQSDYEVFWEEFSGRYTEEELLAMTNSEQEGYISAYVGGVINLINRHIDTVTYGEETAIQVRVEETTDGFYEMNKQDFQAVDMAIIAY